MFRALAFSFAATTLIKPSLLPPFESLEVVFEIVHETHALSVSQLHVRGGDGWWNNSDCAADNNS